MLIVDDRNEKIGRKIRDNEMKRIPYMLIVGEKEAENGEVSVRRQGEGDKGTMKFEEFGEILNEEVQNMINKMVTLRPIVKAQHFGNVLKTAFTLIHN